MSSANTKLIMGGNIEVRGETTGIEVEGGGGCSPEGGEKREKTLKRHPTHHRLKLWQGSTPESRFFWSGKCRISSWVRKLPAGIMETGKDDGGVF